MKLVGSEFHELERHEAWIAGFDTPRPSADAVARTKAAMHAELRRRRGQSQRPWRLHPAVGFWTAAAMLLLSVGVVWESTRRYVPAQPVAADLQFAELLPVSPEVLDEDALLTAAAGEMVTLESTLGLPNETEFDELMNDIQDLESELSRLWDS